MIQSPTPSHRLAAGLVARLIHDIAGLAGGITTGLDLYGDPDSADFRDSALDLVAGSGRSLLERLDFYRAAFGVGGEPHTAKAIGRLAATQFLERRARLEWPEVVAELPGPACQALLIMTQIAADGLASNGTVRVTVDRKASNLTLRVEGESSRVLFHPETLAGLAGRGESDGVAGRWAPAFYLHNLVSAAEGALSIEVGGGGFLLEAALPT